MGLLATGSHDYDSAIVHGVEWLLRHQHHGTWDEPHYTGCGFPGYGIGERIDLKKDTARLAQGRELARGIMINYNLYRHYFPMQALGRAAVRFGHRFSTPQEASLVHQPGTKPPHCTPSFVPLPGNKSNS
jgi:squalene-hopene/tetraprenyl-beta-curcumene cyclase